MKKLFEMDIDMYTHKHMRIYVVKLNKLQYFYEVDNKC